MGGMQGLGACPQEKPAKTERLSKGVKRGNVGEVKQKAWPRTFCASVFLLESANKEEYIYVWLLQELI